jgi:hypothetical protein
MTRRRVLLLPAAALVVLAVARPWPGQPGNRVVVRPDGGGPGWDVYLVGGATREEGERLGRHFLERVTLTNGRGGAVALERPKAGGVVVALFLSPGDVSDPANMAQAGRLRDGLARVVFPGEAVALQVCQGPMRLGPGRRAGPRRGRHPALAAGPDGGVAGGRADWWQRPHSAPPSRSPARPSPSW